MKGDALVFCTSYIEFIVNEDNQGGMIAKLIELAIYKSELTTLNLFLIEIVNICT